MCSCCLTASFVKLGIIDFQKYFWQEVEERIDERKIGLKENFKKMLILSNMYPYFALIIDPEALSRFFIYIETKNI